MKNFTLKLFFVLALTLNSCDKHIDQQEKDKTTVADIKKKSQKAIDTKCNPYYKSFDKIEHFYFDIAEEDIWALEEKKNKTSKEKKQLQILIQNTPKNLSEVAVLKDLENIGYVKKEIPENKFNEINSIFCERNHEYSVYSPCIAEYRDVLVFYNNSKIIGTAKICFTCDLFIITGTDANTQEFGQSGDFNKLYSILHK